MFLNKLKQKINTEANVAKITVIKTIKPAIAIPGPAYAFAEGINKKEIIKK